MARKYDASSIIVLEDDRARIRQSPSMYVPNIYKEGAIHIIFEVIDNSIDELAVKEAAGNHIDVTFDKKTKEISVADDGSGVPLEKLLDVLTKLAASGKFNNGEDSAYLTSAGRWGHGLKTATYLSTSFEFTSMREGKSLSYRFEDGLKKEEKKGKSNKHGTFCKFIIDPKIIDTREVGVKDLQLRMEEKSYLYPKIHMTLTVLDDGKQVKVYKYGGKDIMDRLEQWKPDTPPVRITEKRKVTYLKNVTDETLTTENVDIDIVFAFKEGVLDAENRDDFLISYANGAKTYTGGTHNDGLKLGIQKYFKEHVIPKLKNKDKDLPIMPSDMIAGLCAFITVRVVSPIYMGQEKSQFSNQEVKFAVRDAVFDALSGEKSGTTTPMIDFVKRVTKGRMASKKTRKKNVQNAFSKDRPDKYHGIVENLQTDHPELLLVEGDSAADNADTARDPHNQAIYGISRPANIFDMESTAIDRIKGTFNDVLDICGVKPGDKCDPSDSRMKLILMLTDGDIDGDDIAISTICLLAKHCRPLIDAGMVGRVLPPAYSIPVGKGKRIYVRSQREFFDKIVKEFIKHNEIGFKGTIMSKKELRQFIQKNFEYDVRLDMLANRQCCDPLLMEYIAWSYHGHAKDQKKSYWMSKFKSKYVGIHVLVEDGQVILDGDTPGIDYVNLGFDDYFDKHLHKFKAYQEVNRDIYGFSINGEKDKTLYEVMHLVRSYIPDDVERYKGLGELSTEEMRNLCMDVDKRTVIIFKFQDFERDMDKINVIMSTKKQYVEARKDILMNLTSDPLDIDT